MTYRVRIGFRHGLSFLFPHAGVRAIAGVDARGVAELRVALDVIRAVAARFGVRPAEWVFEVEEERKR